MRFRSTILIFGIVNACLFSGLLPLWEGFDEAFHYGYVETLWQTGRLPVLGRTFLPSDVASSLQLAPVSHIVQRANPESTPYSAWFLLPQAEKERRRQQLMEVRPDLKSTGRPNYEVHHPPLPYLLFATVDWGISGAPVTTRVLILRTVASLAAVLLLYFAALSLFRTLALPENYGNAALFLIFCSEMLYATIFHVANDWLAIGVSAMFLATLARFVQTPNQRSATITTLWLAAGLLTKAYFLVFVPLAFAAMLVLVRNRKSVVIPMALCVGIAAPWYARNLFLYRNLSGTHEEFDGIGVRQALASIPQIDWGATATYMARASLWTSNNSFTSFSKTTLDAILLLPVIALGAWIWRFRSSKPAERWLAIAIVLFCVGVAYATCAGFAHTKGESAGASPWYTQVLLLPVVALAWLGLSRWRKYGKVIGTATLLLWTWVLIATWTVKLFPLYSADLRTPMRPPQIWNWYIHPLAEHSQNLAILALAPPSLLYLGLATSVALAVFLAGALIRSLFTAQSNDRLNP